MPQQIRRRFVPKVKRGEWSQQLNPVVQRVFAARGLTSYTDEYLRMVNLLNPSTLGGLGKAVEIVVDAILTDQSIMISGDYDCDGATGTAVAVRGLRLMGAKNVRFIVPNRFVHGYGLSPALVDAMEPKPDLIITVDSGVASVDGVRHAKGKGIKVVVTDHHLPGDFLPDADAMVNPNLRGDEFPSKALAGVGVMFYLLIAISRELPKESIRRGITNEAYWKEHGLPSLVSLLDLVALGTVADLVPLDQNNRILVKHGLERIRRGQACEGVKALVGVSGKAAASLTAPDIGFSVAPRLNAAGRLENMSLGIEMLITDDPTEAKTGVTALDNINQERREIQANMTAEAEQMVNEVSTDLPALGVVVHKDTWHAGVVGLVASKLKESLHRPTVAFAPTGENTGIVVGSGRSIEGYHLRDALARIDVKNPGLILKFGGHAMAAGLSIKTEDIQKFADAFDKDATDMLSTDQLEAIIVTDGELDPSELNMDTAMAIRDAGPWGQAFPEPIFDGIFEVVSWNQLKDKHIKCQLRDPRTGTTYPAIMFNSYKPDINISPRVLVVYQLSINEYRDTQTLQLLVRYMG